MIIRCKSIAIIPRNAISWQILINTHILFQYGILCKGIGISEVFLGLQGIQMNFRDLVENSVDNGIVVAETNYAVFEEFYHHFLFLNLEKEKFT